MNKFLIGIVFLLGTHISVFAQEEEVSEKKSRHAIGAAAGFTTGYGLSYKYSFGKFGVQSTFSPFKDNRKTQMSLGLTFLYTLVKGKNANLFAYQGNHYHYTRRKTKNYESFYDFLNNGLGFGVEFHFTNQVGFSLMGGYASYDSFEGINFTGETSLFYSF